MIGSPHGIKICTRSWSLRRIPAYLRTRSINSSYDKASFLLSRLHPLFSSLFFDALDSAFSSGINQDKCLGNIVGQCLAGTGNGSLWSDTDMYFVWLGEFFLTVLTLITVSDIRSMASTNSNYEIHKSPRKADTLHKPNISLRILVLFYNLYQEKAAKFA